MNREIYDTHALKPSTHRSLRNAEQEIREAIIEDADEVNYTLMLVFDPTTQSLVQADTAPDGSPILPQ